jgi:phenylalanyl-tRNA synthetase beta chain
MKISELWLREWANPALTAPQLAALLTMAGLEVDSVNPVAGEFEGVIVGEVISTQVHPQADKLTLCQVNGGLGKSFKVVCGATNVRPGLKVALAQIDASLPGDVIIKESLLRGELSQGMLCSATELGLADYSEGILELDLNAPVGTDLRTYLALNDSVFDINLTPNRADCFSILGIAREVAALTQVPLTPMTGLAVKPALDEKISVKLYASQACPHYTSRIIRGINPKARTPMWMTERLRRSGIRSIHPVVDVMNYVMLELGQPMHAFDLTKLEGNIAVRFAKNNESLMLLDGQTITLNEKVLVIADAQKILAMAGIMGGRASAVEEQTTDIFLESAFFNPINIAGIARKYGLFTDASQRYERGVDPQLQIRALERATCLLLDIVGGDASTVQEASEAGSKPQKIGIDFNPEKVGKITGLKIAHEEMIRMLEGLGMCIERNSQGWRVEVPSHRFDIRLDVDLVEEIVRLYGYDRLAGSNMVTKVQVGTINPLEAITIRLSRFFCLKGYHETVSYSFVDPTLQNALYPGAAAMQLLNPISSELSQMRVGMWPGLLASMIYNNHRQQNAMKLFESGVIFELSNEGSLKEHPCLAGLLVGEYGALNWSEKAARYDFYDAKGDLQLLFSSLQLKEIDFLAAEHPALHPAKSAQIILNGQKIGWCGVLHPRIADELDMHEEVILFELRLAPLINQTTPRYQPISKFPQIRRDLSFLVANEISALDIEKTVRKTVNVEQLKSFDIFDVYKGGNIPADKKSMAIALTLQDDQRTMVDSEINMIISAIIKKLEENFAIILRD